MNAQRIALTSSTHGIKAAPGVCKTTIVFGFTAATLATKSFCFYPKDRLYLSLPSVEYADTKTIATSASLAN